MSTVGGHLIGDGGAAAATGVYPRRRAPIFHGTSTPLTVWFAAAWHLTSGKGGISATELQPQMEFGSYKTAWAMLHHNRSVMVRPGRGY